MQKNSALPSKTFLQFVDQIQFVLMRTQATTVPDELFLQLSWKEQDLVIYSCWLGTDQSHS